MNQTEISAAAQTATNDGASELDRLLQRSYSPRDMLEGDSMDKMMRLAEQLAHSKLSVPEHLRSNVGDCFAVVMQAMLWNMNAFAVAQKTHLVSGRLGYEAQLVNAVVQNSGAVRGAPRYEYQGTGDALECRAGFVLRGETEVTWGEWLRSSSVTTKNSPLWKTNPKQQLGYLQIKNWARAFCPGAILGVYTVDELEDNLPPMPSSIADQPPRGPQRKSDGAAKRAEPAAEQGPKDPTPAAPADKPAAATATPVAGCITVGQAAYLRNKLKAAEIEEASACARFSVEKVEQLNADQFDTLKADLLAMA